MNETLTASDCWTRGGSRLVYQHCGACTRQWLFLRGFCPYCGATEPQLRAAAGTGTVAASTLVHRAPDDVFRALAPYRLVLVDLDEGLRLMAHADAGLRVGLRVRGQVRSIAGRPMPYFTQDPAP